MPTYNRRRFVSQAIAYFKRQDYPRTELIIVDDGEDCIRDAVPDDPRLRYIRLNQKQPLGAKRNIACSQARGSVICHWDDDDWTAPRRIRYQVDGLRASGAEACGLNRLYFYDPFGRRSWRYQYPQQKTTLLAGGSLCYHKRLWDHNPFPATSLGEDAAFLWNGRPKKLLAHRDSTFYVALTHPGNTNPRHPNRQRWSVYPNQQLEAMLGADLAFYSGLSPRPSNSDPPQRHGQ
jgi:glycosyltransferase involved in cell wall biosynthesis